MKLQWTDDARGLLKTISSGYLRRRTRARIEKVAKVQRLPVITKELTLKMIEETTGETQELKHDSKTGVSPVWMDEAVHRLELVPAGFMRNMTKEKIEKLALEKGKTKIDLSLSEEAIGKAKETMTHTIVSYLQSDKDQKKIREDLSSK